MGQVKKVNWMYLLLWFLSVFLLIVLFLFFYQSIYPNGNIGFAVPCGHDDRIITCGDEVGDCKCLGFKYVSFSSVWSKRTSCFGVAWGGDSCGE